jgi:hypothetical protein
MPNNATGSLHATGTLSAVAAYSGENDPVPPLLNHDDYGTFASLDLDYYLGLASDRIRDFCDWHIFPSLTHTVYCDLTGDGTIFLPTTHATQVVSVTPSWPGACAVDSCSYFLDKESSVIRFNAYGYGFAPTPNSASLWPIDTVRLFDAYPKHFRKMLVTFTHGYNTIPPTVQGVAFEMLMRALEKPAGVASQVQAGPYRFVFNEFGFVLSEDQKNRLAKHRQAAVA